MLKLNDMDWQEIVDKYDLDIHYDTLRKAQQTIFGGAFVSEYMKLHNVSDKNTLQQVKNIVGEQFLLKKQLQTEKNTISKIKNEFVKSISIAEEIIEAMRNEGLHITIPETCKTPIIDTSEKTMVLIISDWHIGYKIINCKGNYYNYEIANERINKLIGACKKYIDLYDIKKVFVYNIGDTVEHSYMRKNQNQYCEFYYNEQVTKATKLIFRMLTELSEYGCNVVYDSIAGNHDRGSGDKTQNYDGDNVNGIITPVLKDFVELSENKRVFVIDRNHADNEIVTEINGVSIKLVHGDKNLKNDSLKNEISMDNEFYDMYITGHWHNFKCVAENRGRYVINNGCLSGFNDYSTAFGCATDAEQTIIILGQNEVELVKDINLFK